MANYEVTIKITLRNIEKDSYFWEEPEGYIFDMGEPWISGQVEEIKEID